MFERVRADLRQFATVSSRGRRAGALHALVNLGPQALVVYRLGRWLREGATRPARWIPMLLLWPVYGALAWLVRRAYDIRIELSAELGPGLKMFHFGGIRLRRCKLGEGCFVHHEVVVEPAEPGGPGPEIGDHVWIGPHARIIGPVRVGDRATIAAGALVTEDVASGALVAGAPARTTLVHYDNSALLAR